MSGGRSGHLTRLFERWRSGEEEIAVELLPQVYDELRSLADAFLSGERSGHTLQATELVNEAFLRLMGADVEALDRKHFFALAAGTMRRILVDHARRRQAGKRFSSGQRVTLVTAAGATPTDGLDVLDLHRALEQLSEIAPRPARLVELRYFGGLTLEEAAEVIGISRPTAVRDWKSARVWLHRRLAP